MEPIPNQTSAFGLDDTAALDAVAIADLIRVGELSAAESAELAINRATKVNPTLNAIALPCFDSYRLGDPQAPFAGVPIFLKDNEDLLGAPTSHGSLAMPRTPARRSSGFAQQLAELGFTIIGKSTLPEFGLTASTESDRFGATRNPWNSGHSIGGSSGGSAALVASGAVALSHANDGGGSIRIPASCGGLVGLKPTRDRLIPADGTEHMPINLVTQGAVTRSVRDTAALFAALEQIHANPDLPPVGAVAAPNQKRLKIGFFADSLGGLQPDQDTLRTLRETATLCADLGHDVTEIQTPFDEQVAKDFLRYWSALAASLTHLGPVLFGREFQRSQVGTFTRGLSSMFLGRAITLPGSLRRLRAFGNEYNQMFDQYDVLLSPVLSHEPPPIGYLGPDVDFHTHLLRLLPFVGYTVFQNISGAPAISLPSGTSANGLPIGMQFAAKHGRDRRLLELALQIEEARPWGFDLDSQS
jgi:amidase